MVKKNNQKEMQKSWMDSTMDLAEFRTWDVEKQLDAIVEFAKAQYSLEK